MGDCIVCEEIYEFNELYYLDIETGEWDFYKDRPSVLSLAVKYCPQCGKFLNKLIKE